MVLREPRGVIPRGHSPGRKWPYEIVGYEVPLPGAKRSLASLHCHRVGWNPVSNQIHFLPGISDTYYCDNPKSEHFIGLRLGLCFYKTTITY
jgi:hypothetical protein